MKQKTINGKIWEFDIDDVDGDILITAKNGDSTFADWLDMGHCCLTTVDHAACENLAEDDEVAIRKKINADLEELAVANGYTPGGNYYGYAGTLEYAGDDNELAEKIMNLYTD